MKTLEDYKQALETAGPHLREKLLAQADADGLMPGHWRSWLGSGRSYEREGGNPCQKSDL